MSDQITNRIPPEHPASTPTPHPQGSQKALVLGFILFGIVAIGLGSYFLYSVFNKVKKGPPSRSTPELGEPVATYGAQAFRDEFDSNPVAFEKKYKGKTIRLRGIVGEIRPIEMRDGDVTKSCVYVWLVDSERAFGVTYGSKGTLCFFTSLDAVESLHKGQSIELIGIGYKNTVGENYPRLHSCTLTD